MTDTLEHTAQRIAERGHEALLARLRPAVEQAAGANADVVELDAEQLERLTQRATDHANGLQWRRALADVAAEELGIGLCEALIHPAVARAQAIVGAQSYEEALSELASGSLRPAPGADAVPTADGVPTADAVPIADAEPGARVQAEPESRVEDAASDPEEQPLSAVRLAAIHIAGVENLKAGEKDLELRFSDAGLDIIRTASGSVLGRLPWNEIEALEMPANPTPRRSFRRRKARVQLLVRTERGEATFETPDVADDELREHLAPMLARARGASSGSSAAKRR